MLIAKPKPRTADPQDYPITFKNNLESTYNCCSSFIEQDLAVAKRSVFMDMTLRFESIQRILVKNRELEN